MKIFFVMTVANYVNLVLRIKLYYYYYYYTGPKFSLGTGVQRGACLFSNTIKRHTTPTP